MRTLSKDSEKILEFLDKFKIDKTIKIKIGNNLKSIYKIVVLSFKKIDEQSEMTEIVCMKKLLHPQKQCNLLRAVKTIYSNPQLQKYLQSSFTDNEKIKLINDGNLKYVIFDILNGVIDEKTIDSIDIIHKSDKKGYARQNNLIPGKWISINIKDRII